jgi:Tol biopolymer transport system component
VVNADGSALTRLTDSTGAGWFPTWSGDGQQIYFVSTSPDDDRYYGLWAMNPDGTNVRSVLSRQGAVYDVSPDGTRIAFPTQDQGSPEGPPQTDLYVRNFDGTGLMRLVDLPNQYCDNGFLDCPDISEVRWSPDGQRIAYSTRLTGRALSQYSDLGVVNADGTGQQVLVQGAWSRGPAWSPDGQRIAYTSGEPTGIPKPTNLLVKNADGTGTTLLLDGHVDGMVYSSPSWSPDGQFIFFLRYPVGEGDASELYTVHVDGTELRRVPGDPAGVYYPEWSPVAPSRLVILQMGTEVLLKEVTRRE